MVGEQLLGCYEYAQAMQETATVTVSVWLR